MNDDEKLIEGGEAKFGEVSSLQLANLLNITQRRVNDLAANGTFKRTEDGRFKAGECVQAYVQYKVDYATSQLDLGEARARKENAEANLKELQLAQIRGEVINVEALKKELGDIAVTISNRIYHLPELLRRKVEVSDELEIALFEVGESILYELRDAETYKKYLPEVVDFIDSVKSENVEVNESGEDVEIVDDDETDRHEIELIDENEKE